MWEELLPSGPAKLHVLSAYRQFYSRNNEFKGLLIMERRRMDVRDQEKDVRACE